MGVFIAYDLIGTDEGSEDYKKLIDTIKTLTPVPKIEYSLWVSDTALQPKAVRDTLAPFLDKNDKLIVMPRVNGSAWRGQPADVSQWFKDYPA